MEEAAGIYRNGPAMTTSIDVLRGLQERVTRVGVRDTSRTWNTELVAALEVANMLDTAECILASGLLREESRGAHQRTDHPGRDDERFLTHHLAYRVDDGPPLVKRLPVTITRWAPGERVYGR
jgi:fumarate reductase flavoprotein subunit